MLVERLVSRHPEAFHVASEESWPSIQRHGLLSTMALLDLHNVDPRSRAALVGKQRTVSTRLLTPGVGVAVVRDQKPLKFIDQKIDPTSSLRAFLTALSSRVFFAPSDGRLQRLLRAREHRGSAQVVITIGTAALVSRYEQKIELCRFNSWACTQLNHPVRGHRSWLPIADYPYDEFRRRHGGDGLAEITVTDSVPDVLDMTTSIEHVQP